MKGKQTQKKTLITPSGLELILLTKNVVLTSAIEKQREHDSNAT
jgi:hypothetical protein